MLCQRFYGYITIVIHISTQMLDQDGDVIMLRVSPFTIISGGATGVDCKAETLAKHHGLPINVLVPPCHPRSKTIHPLSYSQLQEANPWIRQAEHTLDRRLTEPISRQYIQRNFCLVKQADLVLAFTCFEPRKTVFGLPVNTTCMGGTGWAVEFAKMLRKPLYVYELTLDFWFWYDYDNSRFEQCEGMSDTFVCLPTFVPKTAIVGVRNFSEFPQGNLELERTFARSLFL